MNVEDVMVRDVVACHTVRRWRLSARTRPAPASWGGASSPPATRRPERRAYRAAPSRTTVVGP